jgi:UDP-N-acetylglucosamine--N-acetylmuramyl-(pentapeptide) pyrophosphoryl-undecaprenol N-acetylglucosamine transferase
MPYPPPPRPLAVVIAGGGTGGHLYPGIAVAREIVRRAPDARVTFAGTARGLEARVVPREGFELDLIRSAGLKGKAIASRLRGLAVLPMSFFDAWRLLSRRRPRVVIGVGGYSSGPVVLSAALRGMPTMVLEQNAQPGFTNRALARWVKAAAVTYQETLHHFGNKGFVAGNPVRAEFFATGRSEDRPLHAPRLLVLGGSQGAHAINVAVTAAAPRLRREHPGLEIVHQTGERDLAWARDQYRQSAVPARVEAFLDPVAAEMHAADVAVSRAGATTLAELEASGTPAVLVPFPAATDDHQRKNAEVLVRGGAAALVNQADLTGDRLAAEVGALLADRSRLAAMRTAMRGFAQPGAAERIVDRVLALAGPAFALATGGR